MLLWCLISPCPSKIVCSNNTTGTFYSCRMVSCCLLCYSIYSNPLCPMQYCLHRLMEQLSIPGKELLWCLICLCPSKVVCSNNIIGTFYSCRMVSTCFIFIILIMFYMLFCIRICYVYCFLCKLNQSFCCYGLEIVFDKSLWTSGLRAC